MKKLILPLLLLTTTPCFIQAQDEDVFEHEDDLLYLSEWLVDTYTTEGEELLPQYEEHQIKRFVRIWEDYADHWFYMERSNVSTPDKPNRQWVFSVEQMGEHMMFELYLLPKGLEVKGGLSQAELEAILDIDRLRLENGCEMFLNYDGFAVFNGETVEQFCELNEHGGHHTKMRMMLTAKKLDWYEAACDPDDKVLWGSIEEAQIYSRKK